MIFGPGQDTYTMILEIDYITKKQTMPLPKIKKEKKKGNIAKELIGEHKTQFMYLQWKGMKMSAKWHISAEGPQYPYFSVGVDDAHLLP